MFFNTVIRGTLLPAAVVVAESNPADPKQAQNEDTYLLRPSELPIYTSDPPSETTQQGECHGDIVKDFRVPNVIENSVRTVRETVQKYYQELHAYERVALDVLSESKQNLDGVIGYLRQEDNTMPKAGAIGIGALTGFIFGLRGGFIKKTLYATTGAVGMAAVCYPKEASEYSQLGLAESKKFATIAYNFIHGVKKDDPPLELPSLPKLPTTASEVWGSIKSIFISEPDTGRPQQDPKK